MAVTYATSIRIPGPTDQAELKALALLLGEPLYEPTPADQMGIDEACLLVEVLAGAGITIHLVDGRLVVRGDLTLNMLAGLVSLHAPLMQLALEQQGGACG